MTPGQIAVLVGVFLVMDAFIVSAVIASCAMMFNDVGKGLPWVTPEPGAECRRFQSIKIGMFNLGGSVHLTLDSRYVHFDPTWIMRKGGAKGFSVPRELIAEPPDRPSKPGARRVRAIINAQEAIVPAWIVRVEDSGDRSGPRGAVGYTGPGGEEAEQHRND